MSAFAVITPATGLRLGLPALEDQPDRAREDGKHYRFSVRCNRLTNIAIERAARAARLTPAAYVQQHFDAIGKWTPPPRKVEGAFRSPDAIRRCAEQHGIGGVDATILLYLHSIADENRIARASLPQIGAATKIPRTSAGRAIDRLEAARLLDLTHAAQDGRVFQLMGEG